jgi:hypothetical protein
MCYYSKVARQWPGNALAGQWPESLQANQPGLPAIRVLASGASEEDLVMTKTEKNIVTTQPNKAPSPKTDFVAVTAEDLELSDLLAVLQVQQSVQVPSGASEQMYSLTRGAIARYRDFAPADATERHLVTLCVGLENAVMVSLRHAAGTDVLPVRTEELKHAMSATRAVTKLLDTLERRRGRGKQSVTVGQVTVETGGQAIVGNVNSESRRSTKSKEMEDPNSDPSPQEEK